VLPRRFLLLIGLVLALFAGGISLARRVSEHLPYNCIINGGISVQLNRHLEFDVPRVFGSLDSPDGRTAIQLFGTTDRKVIRLVDTETGATTLVPDAIRAGLWTWSPNSQYVFYNWADRQGQQHYVISSHDGARSAELNPGSWVDALDYSADAEYLALQYEMGPTLVFVSTQTFASTRVTPQVDWGYPLRVAWSPTGHQFVYVVGDQLIAVDPETGASQQITYLNQSGVTDETMNRYSLAVEWSPDERYLSVTYRLETPLQLMRMFAVDGLTLTPVETIVLQVDQNVTTHMSGQFAHWSAQGHTFVYIRPSGPDPVFHDRDWEKRLYDLWHFDPETRLHRLALSDMRSFAFNTHTLATVRWIDDHNSVELRTIGGTDPLVVGTYPAIDFTAAAFDRWCSWCRCWWYTQPDADLLDCDIPGFPWQMVSVDDDGRIRWAWEIPPGAENIDVPFGIFSRDGRFTAAVWQQGERVWVELVDLQTGTIYPVPEVLNATLPPDVVDTERLAPLWLLEVIRSPDDHTWLVHFEGNHTGTSLYRLLPVQNTWDLLYHNDLGGAGWITWSPDSRRIAFTAPQPGLPAPSLIVMEADGSQQWDLGYFPTIGNLAWSKCGGIRAALTDD
jgi:hypothetical protein